MKLHEVNLAFLTARGGASTTTSSFGMAGRRRDRARGARRVNKERSSRSGSGKSSGIESSRSPSNDEIRTAVNDAFYVEDAASAAVVFVVSLTVYIMTLYPTVAGGDSGELVAQSCSLGIAHPPGYPLFTLLSHAFVRFGPPVLKFGESLLNPLLGLPAESTAHTEGLTPAWYSNLFSAICDALAALFIARSVALCSATFIFRSNRDSDAAGVKANGARAANVMANVAGTASGLMFALSPLIWTYAVGSEVFALNNVLMAALVHTLLRYSIFGRQSDVCVANVQLCCPTLPC